MLEKLGIRIITSLIVLWYIAQMSFMKVYIDFYTFMILLLYAVLLSLMIESLYSLLRSYLEYIFYMIFIMFLISLLIYNQLGWGMYLGMSLYVFLSLSIDLYREYSLTKLLKRAIRSHDEKNFINDDFK